MHVIQAFTGAFSLDFSLKPRFRQIIEKTPPIRGGGSFGGGSFSDQLFLGKFGVLGPKMYVIQAFTGAFSLGFSLKPCFRQIM